MPKNKQKKIVCMSCKEHYNPLKHSGCPVCMQTNAIAYKPPSNTKVVRVAKLEKTWRR